MILIDIHEVQTMKDVGARAEALAWITFYSYRYAGRYAYNLSRTDRAVNLLKARDYRRRAIRVSQWLNRRARSPHAVNDAHTRKTLCGCGHSGAPTNMNRGSLLAALAGRDPTRSAADTWLAACVRDGRE